MSLKLFRLARIECVDDAGREVYFTAEVDQSVIDLYEASGKIKF